MDATNWQPKSVERCPFCQTEVPDGAIVCRGCGANKRPAVDAGRIGCGTLIFVFMGLGLLDTRWWPLGLIIIGLCAALIIYAVRANRRPVWVRRLH